MCTEVLRIEGNEVLYRGSTVSLTRTGSNEIEMILY